jgi:trimethylamine--corrinoid protein Co-methyltransferase
MARRGRDKTPVVRNVNYPQLRNPFPPMGIFSADEIASMYETALRTLEELGMKVLLSEARAIFAKGGAKVTEVI